MEFLLKNTPKVKIIDDAKLAIKLDIDVNGSAANRI